MEIKIMDKTPLVTIAIAAYNVEKYLDKGMHFVLSQTYKNIEIILVDDGSTDSTPVLCDRLAKIDKRIRVFHKENGGLGSARNVGIENANGEFLYFFDVDDSIEPNLIEDNVRLACENDVDLIIFSFFAKINGESLEEKICLNDELITSNNRLKEKYCNELLFTKHGNGFAWNKFYRMSFIKQFNFRFGDQRIQQDEPFNMQLYLKLDRVLVSSQAYYHYVIYNLGNAGSRYLPDKFDIISDVYHHFIKFYNEWKINNDKVYKYIERRYAFGIVNVVTSNACHPDNDFNLLERCKYVKKVLNNREAMMCIQNTFDYSTKDPIIFCAKHKLCMGVIVLYSVKVKMKRYLKVIK